MHPLKDPFHLVLDYDMLIKRIMMKNYIHHIILEKMEPLMLLYFILINLLYLFYLSY